MTRLSLTRAAIVDVDIALLLLAWEGRCERHAREGRVCSRRLERPPTGDEAAILDPDLSRLADPASAAVARAELGFGSDGGELRAYALS